MARRQSTAEDLIEITAKLPWWAGVLLAVLAYVGLHAVATMPLPASPKDLNGLAGIVGPTLYRTLAGLGQYVLPLIFLIGAAASAFGRWRRAGLHAKAVSAGSVARLDISWEEFELLVGEAFRRRGYSVVEAGGPRADGGVDLVLSKDGERFLVQCKHWRALKVGVAVVRELYGVMAARGATGGFVVSSGEFSSDAIDFAQGRNVELIGGAKLFKLLQEGRAARAEAGPIARTSPNRNDNQTASPAPDTQPAPACPRCNEAMVRRRAKQGSGTGEFFWGCSSFPRCRGTRPYI